MRILRVYVQPEIHIGIMHSQPKEIKQEKKNTDKKKTEHWRYTKQFLLCFVLA